MFWEIIFVSGPLPKERFHNLQYKGHRGRGFRNVSSLNPSDPDRFLLHLRPEGLLNLTPPNISPSFPFFTIKGMECISNLRLAHFVRLKLGFEEN